MELVPLDLEYIKFFLKIGMALEGMKALERNYLSICVTPYMLVSGDLYKLGHDEVLHQCMLEHERLDIIEEAHGGSACGIYAEEATTHKIL